MKDIVIIGGGIVGSAVACYLGLAGAGARVVVIERDPTYEFASTPRSAGGVRQQFSLPENIRMSQYGLEVYRDFEARMAVDGEAAAPVDFRRGGYLFLASAEGRATLEANHRIQRDLGAPVELLDPAEIRARFPSIATEGVVAGSLGADDGWIDPHAALQGFRRKARSLGATYRADEVVAIERAGNRIAAVTLASGERLAADAFVNAAGAWAGKVAAMAGMALPVEPVRRMVFYFETREALEPLPLVIDPTGTYFRPEGRGYICGRSNPDEPAGVNFEVDYDWFETAIWPVLAARVPAFEAIRVQQAWAGLYAVNRLDANAIIGPWEGGCENFYVACGFSGHGLQQAPAVGRALAELLLEGRFVTLDLSRLGYRRVLDNAPLPEAGIV